VRSEPSDGVVRILLLEDSDSDAQRIEEELRTGGVDYVLRRVNDELGLKAALREFDPQVVLSDYQLQGCGGTGPLAMVRRLCPQLPVIVVSGSVGEETTVEMMKEGATDFVLKDRLKRLAPAVGRAMREVEEREALARMQAELYSCNMELEARVRDRTRELREKNELMEEELRMAHELQQALLPRHFPLVPAGAEPERNAVRVCSFYRASHFVGGDCFNVTRVSETALSVFICDVMGHGVRAALVTAMLRALEEQFGEKASDPALLLSEMNRALCHIFDESETLVFASACALTVDIARARVTFSNAGHPTPLLVRRAERRVAVLGEVPLSQDDIPSEEVPIDAVTSEGDAQRGILGCNGTNGRRGPALGIFPQVRYSNHKCEVKAGDVLLLFTDGLFEVENSEGELFGETGLIRAVSRAVEVPPEGMIRSAVEEAEKFAAGRPFADDMCVVGVEIAHLLEPALDGAPKIDGHGLQKG
jgi:serine phosphatase RsbU (regulator of sigma subunit)